MTLAATAFGIQQHSQSLSALGTATEPARYSPDAGSHKVLTVDRLVLHDSARRKDVPVKIYYPDGRGPFPVIIFSHGAFASKNTYWALGEYWASYGYVSIHPSHDDSRQDGGYRGGLMQVLRDSRLWESRPRDISFVALMLQKNSALTPDQVKARLMKTAYKVFPQYSTATDPTTGISYTSQYDIFTVGAGYLDVQAALASTDLAPSASGSAASPAVAVDASGNVYIITGSSVIWGNSVLWGDSVVWGTSVIWGTNVSGQSFLWGSSVCWGSSTTQGYSVLWGSSVLWGTTSTDATEATALTINGEN